MKRYEIIESIFSILDQAKYKVAGSVALYCLGLADRIDVEEKLTLVTDDLKVFKSRIGGRYKVFSSGVDRIDITFPGVGTNVRIIECKNYDNLHTKLRILPVSTCREVNVMTRACMLKFYISRVSTGNISTIEDTEFLDKLTKQF